MRLFVLQHAGSPSLSLSASTRGVTNPSQPNCHAMDPKIDSHFQGTPNTEKKIHKA